MPLTTLACGPQLGDFIPFLVIAGLGLTVGKYLLYAGFVQAFRYRVSTPVPLPRSRVWLIPLLRAYLGILIIGGTWFGLYQSPVGDRLATQIIWFVAVVERLAIWLVLGALMAHLRGRRLLGWTLSGTAIDIASDAALYFTGSFGLASPVTGTGAILAYIGALYYVGRRESLLRRFAQWPICTGCGYDLTGLPHGIPCPECGAVPDVRTPAP